jgi:hypothetical protein
MRARVWTNFFFLLHNVMNGGVGTSVVFAIMDVKRDAARERKERYERRQMRMLGEGDSIGGVARANAAVDTTQIPSGVYFESANGSALSGRESVVQNHEPPEEEKQSPVMWRMSATVSVTRYPVYPTDVTTFKAPTEDVKSNRKGKMRLEKKKRVAHFDANEATHETRESAQMVGTDENDDKKYDDDDDDDDEKDLANSNLDLPWVRRTAQDRRTWNTVLARDADKLPTSV